MVAPGLMSKRATTEAATASSATKGTEMTMGRSLGINPKRKTLSLRSTTRPIKANTRSMPLRA